ncbi:MAG: GNAT family N-acetyltransferase, partial [Actinomycetia bacterium]|nr:GNAT family N-acetyltransferase [Actinomycetes bacterium]
QQAWDASLFLGRVAGHLVRHHRAYDTIVVTNAPPVFLAALIRFVTRFTGASYVYHCQDLQPEAGLISGDIPTGVVSRALLRIDRNNCRNASAVVVLSSDMRGSLVGRGLPDHNIHIINNFIIESASVAASVPVGLPPSQRVFRVVFAGNMGRFQGLERIIDAARILVTRQEIQFVFMGSGSEMESLQSQAGTMMGHNVVFVPHQPITGAMAVLAESQLGLVPLRPEMYRVAYPSKVMAYVEAGCRLLLLMECESEAAQTVDQCGIGRCCQATDPQAIADAILAEYRHYVQHGSDRERIRDIGHDLFSKEIILPKWSDLFASLDRVESSDIQQTLPADCQSKGLVIRSASAIDIDAIIAVHTAAFPMFTMTRLGSRFLRRYYEIVLNYERRVFLVAEDEHRAIVGFIAGFMNPPSFYKEFRHHRWALGWAALPALARHPALALQVRAGSDWASDQTANDQSDVCELASIGIRPAAAGKGIGSSLVKRFTNQAFATGATEVTLTTDAKGNAAVQAFYKRLGFQNTGELHRGSDRQMVEYRLYSGVQDV